MPIRMEKLDTNFKFQVAAQEGGRYIKSCYSCGACVGSCSANQIFPEFNPRKIIHMILVGLKKDLLSSGLIWYCTLCHNCDFVCPQDVNFSAVMEILHNIALKEGHVDHNYLSQIGRLAVVKEELCSGCVICVRACPWHVPFINERGVAQIEPVKCKACGICAAECPARAIQLKEFSGIQRKVA